MKTKRLVRIALFTAVTAVLAQISVPSPSGIPLTLQTFAVALCGYCLGSADSAASIGVYIALGAAGVPVFSFFGGGLSAVVGPTGGFLIGFVFLAALSGISRRRYGIVWGLLGLCLCHLTGILWYMHFKTLGFAASAALVSAPFAVKDIISVVLAWLLSHRILTAIKK